MAWIVTAAVAAPLLVLCVRVAHGRWLSLSDTSAIELRTRDVGTWHTPLVGPYSRYGWNHPGPLLFWVLALPYRVLGADGRGLLIGALIVNAAAVACVAVVLWRRGRAAALMLGLAVMLLLARALGAGFLIDPWNPHVIVLPLFAVVCLSWAAADGDLWALPAAIAVGSFAVQSHVGVALAVCAPIAVAIVSVVLAARRDKDWARLRTTAIWSGAVAVVCWAAPLVQQFQPGGGNLGELARFWVDSHRSTTGWSAGARIVAQQLSLPAPWFTGDETVNPFTGGVDPHFRVPAALLLLIGALALAAYRRDRQALALDTLALATTAAAFVSAAKIVDAPYVYIVQWMWIVGAIVWFAIVWTVWRALAHNGARDHVATWVGAAASAVLVGWLVVAAVHAHLPLHSDERSLVAIAPAARQALRALPGPVLVADGSDFHSSEVARGILLVAIRAGVDARLAPNAATAVGSAHTISEARARSLVVVAVNDKIDTYRADPTYRRVASYDPIAPAERAERSDIEAEVRRAEAGGIRNLQAWYLSHPKETARAHDLDSRGPRIELFLQAP